MVHGLMGKWSGIGESETGRLPFSSSAPSLCVRRLAKKKAKAEAKRRELEAAQKMEEERLLAKHKVFQETGLHAPKFPFIQENPNHNQP